jgi:hypothetical protein
VPLAITGSSGAGKTKIWSRLTVRTQPDAISLTTDDGYMLIRRKHALALTTVPGQLSRSRYVTLEILFGPSTVLRGVIFVASNGFDHIWPRNADLVANSLAAYDLQTLRKRNLREELSNFRDICDKVIQKHLTAPQFAPQWLLVAVNKADLYWDQLDSSERYYLPGSGGDFDLVAQGLINRVGNLSLDYRVLPLATESSEYALRSVRGTIHAQSQLTQQQCDASVKCVIETLEELCGQ